MTAFSETASARHCGLVVRASGSGAENHGFESHSILFLEILSPEILSLEILPPGILPPAIFSAEILSPEALTPGNPREGRVGRGRQVGMAPNTHFLLALEHEIAMASEPGAPPPPPPTPQRLHPGGVTYGKRKRRINRWIGRGGNKIP